MRVHLQTQDHTYLCIDHGGNENIGRYESFAHLLVVSHDVVRAAMRVTLTITVT